METRIFGVVVRQSRKSRGMTLGVVSRMTGLSRAYICMVEKGKAPPPSPSRIDKLAHCLWLPVKGMQLLAYLEKAPKRIRNCPELLEFREKVMATLQEGGCT
jgi:transcriptional regulator with XRE-family HTH domain